MDRFEDVARTAKAFREAAPNEARFAYLEAEVDQRRAAREAAEA